MNRCLIATIALLATIAAGHAELVPAEKTSAMLEGAKWTSLFDGTSLKGWVGTGYAVEEGAITCTKEGKFLRTEKEYADFVLDFDFKLKPGTNNGIGIRYPGEGDAAYAGMELQILDDAAPQYHNEKFTLAPYQYHGSVYGIQPSTQSEKSQLKPVGEWNHQTVICIGDHVKVILNGVTITDCYLDSIEPVDHKDHPGKKRKTGYIAFCGHGDWVAYKNVNVIDYTAATALPKSSGDNTAPEGFKALFNGKDLTGWNGMVGDGNPFKRKEMTPEALEAAQAKANTEALTHWTVKDGVIEFDGKGKNLCTAKPYGDFEFYVDWKIPATADSGIYLRSTPQIQIWDPSNPAQFAVGAQKGSGGMWNNKGPGLAGKDPLVKADKAIGEWNTFHIRMVGERVTIHLNDKLIVDNQILENYWKSGTPLPREAFIELQNHGNNLFFKNLYVRELPY